MSGTLVPFATTVYTHHTTAQRRSPPIVFPVHGRKWLSHLYRAVSPREERCADLAFCCRISINLTPSTSYQRLLVHRCSAYYKLSPEADSVTKSIAVYFRSESRMYVTNTAPSVVHG